MRYFLIAYVSTSTLEFEVSMGTILKDTLGTDRLNRSVIHPSRQKKNLNLMRLLVCLVWILCTGLVTITNKMMQQNENQEVRVRIRVFLSGVLTYLASAGT